MVYIASKTHCHVGLFIMKPGLFSTLDSINLFAEPIVAINFPRDAGLSDASHLW